MRRIGVICILFFSLVLVACDRDAEDMLKSFCESRIIEKTRYFLHYAGFLWEVDVFEGRHKGLIVAEIELSDEDTVFAIPPFVGKEVTDDFAYSNFALSMSQ